MALFELPHDVNMISQTPLRRILSALGHTFSQPALVSQALVDDALPKLVRGTTKPGCEGGDFSFLVRSQGERHNG